MILGEKAHSIAGQLQNKQRKSPFRKSRVSSQEGEAEDLTELKTSMPIKYLFSCVVNTLSCLAKLTTSVEMDFYIQWWTESVAVPKGTAAETADSSLSVGFSLPWISYRQDKLTRRTLLIIHNWVPTHNNHQMTELETVIFDCGLSKALSKHGPLQNLPQHCNSKYAASSSGLCARHGTNYWERACLLFSFPNINGYNL